MATHFLNVFFIQRSRQFELCEQIHFSHMRLNKSILILDKNLTQFFLSCPFPKNIAYHRVSYRLLQYRSMPSSIWSSAVASMGVFRLFFGMEYFFSVLVLCRIVIYETDKMELLSWSDPWPVGIPFTFPTWVPKAALKNHRCWGSIGKLLAQHLIWTEVGTWLNKIWARKFALFFLSVSLCLCLVLPVFLSLSQ